jgi:hypothetical protein
MSSSIFDSLLNWNQSSIAPPANGKNGMVRAGAKCVGLDSLTLNDYALPFMSILGLQLPILISVIVLLNGFQAGV